MGLEAEEQIRHLDVLVHPAADAAGIVKDEASWHAANPVENVSETVNRALRRLPAEELRVAGVAVGEGDAQELASFLLTAGIVDVRRAEPP